MKDIFLYSVCLITASIPHAKKETQNASSDRQAALKRCSYDDSNCKTWIPLAL